MFRSVEEVLEGLARDSAVPLFQSDDFLVSRGQFAKLVKDCAKNLSSSRPIEAIRLRYNPNSMAHFFACLMNGTHVNLTSQAIEPTPISCGTFIFLGSSGTTQKPRVWRHSLETLTSNCQKTVEALGLEREGVVWPIFGPETVSGLKLLFNVLTYGGTIVCDEFPKPHEISSFWKQVDKKRPNVLAVPPIYLDLLNRYSHCHPKGERPQKVFTGGDYLYQQTLARFYEQFKVEVDVLYGTTETGGPISHVPFQSWRPGKIGWPFCGKYRKVSVDNEVFQLEVRGEFLASNFRDRSFTVPDLFRQEGRDLIFCGRIDDAISFNGTTLFPLDIEDAIRKEVDVTEVRIDWNKPKPEYPSLSRTIRVDAKGDPGLENEIRQLLTEFQIYSPEVHWVEALPRSRSGKILRRVF